MNDIFKILDSFAAQFSPEVEGRCAEALDDSTRDTLARLCRGELSEGERQKVGRQQRPLFERLNEVWCGHP